MKNDLESKKNFKWLDELPNAAQANILWALFATLGDSEAQNKPLAGLSCEQVQ